MNINSLNFCISSYFIFILSLFGSIFTTLYSVKVWYYCFVWGVNMNRSINRGTANRYTRSTPPPPLVMPILNSLLIDESPEHCFSLSSFTLFYSSSLFAYSSGVTGLGILLFILINLLLYWMLGDCFIRVLDYLGSIFSPNSLITRSRALCWPFLSTANSSILTFINHHY